METETMTGCHHGMLGFCTKCEQESELAAAKQEIARMQPVFDAAVEYVKIQNEAAALWVDLCTDTDEIEESDNRQYTQFLKLSNAVRKLGE